MTSKSIIKTNIPILIVFSYHDIQSGEETNQIHLVNNAMNAHLYYNKEKGLMEIKGKYFEEASLKPIPFTREYNIMMMICAWNTSDQPVILRTVIKQDTIKIFDEKKTNSVNITLNSRVPFLIDSKSIPITVTLSKSDKVNYIFSEVSSQIPVDVWNSFIDTCTRSYEANNGYQASWKIF